MVIPAGGSIADSIDPSNLMSTFPSSDADWMGKESLEFLPWDLSGNNEQQQAFNLSEEVADGLEFPNPYINGDYTSPMGYRGYTVAAEDALSYASPVSVCDCPCLLSFFLFLSWLTFIPGRRKRDLVSDAQQ
jgi:hypothetical protein